MQRESTGIRSVDQMIQGGLPSKSIIGLSGPPGIGKSIFSLHFLLQGARKGQKCLYINLEEPRNNINHMIRQFDFAELFLKYVKEGKIVIKCFTYSEYENIYSDLIQKIKEDQTINRLVIDSYNCFFASVSSSEESTKANVRRMINQTFSMLREKKLTTILILEMQQDHAGLLYNIPYLTDGSINLNFLELGTIERRLFIPKMRWTDQCKESKVFEINHKGIVVLDEKEED